MHRALLYVPADRIDALWDKASTSGADALIVDLEDGVAPAAKARARDALVRHLSTHAGPSANGPAILVRVNSGDLLDDDLAALAPFPELTVMLPKAEPESLDRLVATGGNARSVVALIESARGLSAVDHVAHHRSVTRLALGEADLCADLGLGPDADHVLWPLRAQVVIASRVADLQPPIAPVCTDWSDLDHLRRSSQLLRAAGFGARSAIHPDQVPTIIAAYTPSVDELSAARRIVELHEQAIAEGRGVTVDDRGRMIDEAVVRSARRLLS